MDVRNCRMCGSIYNYVGGSYKNLCPRCIQKMEDKFQEVKKYIEEHPGANIAEVSQEFDISQEQIQRWVREDRLAFSDSSPVGIPCEGCGATIKSGRFCAKCKQTMVNEFSGAYAQPAKRVKQQDDTKKSARMRFIE